MAGALTPITRWQMFEDGSPAAGALLYTYLSGTSTPSPVYNNADLAIGHAHTNPVEADADGVFPVIYLAALSYRFLVTNADGATIYPAQDNVYDFAQLQAVPQNADVEGTAGETLTLGELAYLSDGSGGLSPGRWYKADADNTYSSLTPDMGFATEGIANGATGTFRQVGLLTVTGPLTPGAVYFASATAGAITVTPPTNVRIVGQAISSTVMACATITQWPATLPPMVGTQLTALNASNLSTGTVAADRLPAGCVRQVVTATYATEVTSSTNSFADTGLTAAITPASASNKVLVFVSQAGCGKENGTGLGLKLVRASSDLITFAQQAGNTNSAARNYIGTVACTYLDSPASNASVTYKTQFASSSNIAAAYVQQNGGSTSTIVLMEVVG